MQGALSPYFEPENIKHLNFGNQWIKESWIYINFLKVGDLVLMPALGNPNLDNEAKSQLMETLKTNNIHLINTTALSLGHGKNTKNFGGALHCISWETETSE